jgi:twitching motility protein PilU
MQLTDYFDTMKAQEASDLYLTADAPPTLRVYGQLKPISDVPLSGEAIRTMAYSILSAEQQKQFEQRWEMNLAISLNNGRFRINVFIQKGQVAMVVRNIHTVIPTLQTLELPELLTQLVMEKRGLVLFVGGTGTGKSTSLASLIHYRNETQAGHIMCIEDPIEFIHTHQKSLVNQREVGIDTISYEEALQNTLRQSPDVILIGEIRNRETMDHAIAFSETGHLCLSTLHANNAHQALDRIINFFPENRRQQLLLDLSFNLKGIISQRLIPTLQGKRVAAIEILLGSPLVLDYIRRGDISAISEAMEKSEHLGMQTFDQSLEKLVKKGLISPEEALKNADSSNNLHIKLETATAPPPAPSHSSYLEGADEPKGKGGLNLADD